VRSLLLPIALAACALSAGPLWADTAANLRTLDDCLARLSPPSLPSPKLQPSHPLQPSLRSQTARGVQPLPAPAGVEELRVLCPDIEQAIIDGGLSTQLPDDWQQWLDRSSIEDLSRLLRRYQSALPSTAPGVPALYQVARTLNAAVPPHGWWQDFKDWLRQWLSPPESTDPSWLNRWLSRVSLPPLLMQSLLYVLMGMILAGTLWIVWRELRLARAGARAGSGAVSRSLPLPADAPRLSLDEVERAPLAEQPALLLRLLVQALLQSGRLSNDRALTHRELGTRSGFDDSAQHERFVRISLLAERLLYGPAADAGARSQFDQALADGRGLYALWTSRAAPAP
jgi:hypothetical protein